jgi:hypothetical protein
MEFLQLLIIAAVLEALWETAKMFWQAGKVSIDRVGAAVLGVFLCVAAGVDFFQMVELPLIVPFAGMVLSGLLVSRGANFVHDFISTVEGIKGNVRG